MKPSWKNAPDWANYLAMDEDGCWYWYKSEPRKSVRLWLGSPGPYVPANIEIDWEDTLEQRPKQEDEL